MTELFTDIDAFLVIKTCLFSVNHYCLNDLFEMNQWIVYAD